MSDSSEREDRPDGPRTGDGTGPRDGQRDDLGGDPRDDRDRAPSGGEGERELGARPDEPRPFDSRQPRGDRTVELPPTVKRRLEAFIPEMVKRTFAAGMGAVFSTEEGIRKLTKDMSLPKEVAGYLATTAGNTKDEIVRIIAREVREFLQGVNLSDEIAKILTTLSFEVKTEIRFIPNDEKYGSVKPDVKSQVRLKRQDDAGRRRRRRRRRARDASDVPDAVSLPGRPLRDRLRRDSGGGPNARDDDDDHDGDDLD